ncbi:MAG: Motility protein B [Deltaproteobacteria bacterium ADurb.Bin510]|nr:MAG: Motility protein B [Deltaproteobacteria bacterium ADurb.Bin510]
MDDDKSAVIIVKKKGKGHGGHHGGAWKVAYADFVTAMMALFIVLWLTSQSDQVKQMVQSYFTDPVAFDAALKAGGSGLMEGTSGMLKEGNPTSPSPESVTKDETKQSIEKLKKEMGKLQSMIDSDPQLAKVKDKISMTVTEEGLRIELEETKDGMFFAVGSADLKPEAVKLLTLISRDVGAMPNNVVIEGHSDARPYIVAGYSNWELSSDRANAARGVMEANGLRPKQVAQVVGFADRKLKLRDKPLDYSNRRVSILVPPFRPSLDPT